MLRLAVLFAALANRGFVDALVIGVAPRSIRSIEVLAAEGADFSAEELAALKEASLTKQNAVKSVEPGDTEMGDFMGNPRKFCNIIRNASGNIPPAVWDPVRERWPVLAGRSNEELAEAVKPIVADYVDLRFLK